MRTLASALAEDTPVFPEAWMHASGVTGYLKARFKATESELASSLPPLWEEVRSQYKDDLNSHCSKLWATNSLSFVKKLVDNYDGKYHAITTLQVRSFISSLEKSNATKNRYLAASSRFFKWCVSNNYRDDNPCAAIKTLREDRPDEIAYCTPAERDRVLAAAKALNRNDWHAVAIALYAVCRREEIFNLKWEDIKLETRRIRIRESKTGKPRLPPIAQQLLDILKDIKKGHGSVFPRAKRETWQNQADRIVELMRETLCRPENPNLAGEPAEVIGKRRFLKTEENIQEQPKRIEEAEKAFAKSKVKGKKRLMSAIALAGLQVCSDIARDEESWIPSERIEWNAWRHTFATLRVQAGVTLDKVSSWMGNSPEVCKRHYAQFMPRDTHDEDIDK